MFVAPQLIKKRIMNSPMLILVAMVLLSGCEAGKNNIEDWSKISERPETTAKRVFFSHDILFSPNGVMLNESEGRRLQIFVDTAAVSGADRVYLVSGSSAADQRRARNVADFLAANNITVLPSLGKTGAHEPPKGSLSVMISRYAVVLPRCPDWSGERFTYNNVPASNWGCATAINLGRMVARPEDLVRGRNPGSFDGEYGARSINLYRKGQTKPLIVEGVSEVESEQQSSSGEGG